MARIFKRTALSDNDVSPPGPQTCPHTDTRCIDKGEEMMCNTMRAKLASMLVTALAVPVGLVVGTAGEAVAATPTCNGVASYAGAWVPYYDGTNTVNCNMVQGNVSQGVRQLQTTLNKCYGENLVEDGDFGSLTKAALIRAQQRAGTTADGIYGPNTRKAIKHEPLDGSTNCVRVP